MREIKCNQCGVHLFDTEKTEGAAGAEAMRKGFIFKLPVFYRISHGVFFCSKDCNKKWMSEHVSPADRAKGNEAVRELKEEVPKMVEDTCAVMAKLQNVIKNTRK